MNRRIVLLPILVLALSSCGDQKPPLVIEKPVIQRVEVKAPCVTEAEYQMLQESAPAPLYSRAIPPTVEERVSILSAQVMAYESPGQWRDKVMVILERCRKP